MTAPSADSKAGIKRALIPAAGLGSRFLPVTKTIPKEMLPLLDRPALEYSVEEARDSGARELLMITRRGKGAMEDHFDRHPELEGFLESRGDRELLDRLERGLEALPEMFWIRQDRALGLGHAVLLGRSFAQGEPLGVLLPDELILGRPSVLSRMAEIRDRYGGTVLAVTPVPAEQSRRYGMIEPESAEGDVCRVRDMVEKPAPCEAPSNLAIIGRYILSPPVFEILESQGPGAGGEIQLTDALRELARSGEPVHALVFKGARFDTGTLAGYLAAWIHLARRDPGLWAQVKEALERGEGGVGKDAH